MLSILFLRKKKTFSSPARNNLLGTTWIRQNPRKGPISTRHVSHQPWPHQTIEAIIITHEVQQCSMLFNIHIHIQNLEQHQNQSAYSVFFFFWKQKCLAVVAVAPVAVSLFISSHPFFFIYMHYLCFSRLDFLLNKTFTFYFLLFVKYSRFCWWLCWVCYAMFM